MLSFTTQNAICLIPKRYDYKRISLFLCDVIQEDVERDNDLHSTVANRIVELAKHDQKKLNAGQSGVAVVAVRSIHRHRRFST